MTDKQTNAIRYVEEGYNVIPTAETKKPLISWEKWNIERVTEDQVKEWWKSFPDANPAIVTGKLSGIVVIDIDAPEGMKEFLDFMDGDFNPDEIPTVKTPRGGYHYYYKYPEELSQEVRNTTNLFTKVDVRGQGGYVLAPPSAGPNGCYEWVENLAEDFPRIPEKLLKKLLTPQSFTPILPSVQGNSVHDSPPVSSFSQGGKGTLFTKGTRDNGIFHLACQFAKAGTPVDEARQYLLFYAAKGCTPPFSEKELERKIESAYERYSRGERNLMVEVKEWLQMHEGVFHTNDLKNSLGIFDKAEKKNIDVILGRLRNEGVIERYGEKRGYFRPVNTTEEEIDIFAPMGATLDLKFPFKIENYFIPMPKNIFVIAGEPNSGKTGFLLSFAEMNMRSNKINYFSSEMSTLELQSRLHKFDIPYEEWSKVRFVERASNFVDVIRPNEVNIIDFLEISTDFFKLAGIMTEIHNKLIDGVCFIAIQKNTGNEYGLGGERGLEKPRLYATISNSHVFRMVKVKNRRDDFVNPNGLACGFKLVGGHKFLQTTPFQR